MVLMLLRCILRDCQRSISRLSAVVDGGVVGYKSYGNVENELHSKSEKLGSFIKGLQVKQKNNLLSQIPSLANGAVCVKVKLKENIYITASEDAGHTAQAFVCSNHANDAVKKEIENRSYDDAIDALMHFKGNYNAPKFETLVQLVAWASKIGKLKDILAIKSIAEAVYHRKFKTYFRFETYEALALVKLSMHSKALALLNKAFVRSIPKNRIIPKKLKDHTSMILLQILGSTSEDALIEIKNAVTTLCKNSGTLYPALVFWKFCFMSKTFSYNKEAENILLEFPELLMILHHKTLSVIDHAATYSDSELLQRLVQLMLQNGLKDRLDGATRALLKVQCDNGDVAVAYETLKFAKKQSIVVSPNELCCFLSILNEQKRPIPMSIMYEKYKYKFVNKPPHSSPPRQYPISWKYIF